MTVPTWTADQLRSHLAGDRPVFVDWWADWCTNCAAQDHVIERLAPELEDQVVLGKIDVGAFPDLADEFGVQSLPTLAMFVDGHEVKALHGYRRAAEIREAVHLALAEATGVTQPGGPHAES
jgi:thioredoxin